MPRKKIQEPESWRKARQKKQQDNDNSTSGKTSWSKKAYMKDLEKADPNYNPDRERADDLFEDIEGM